MFSLATKKEIYKNKQLILKTKILKLHKYVTYAYFVKKNYLNEVELSEEYFFFSNLAV